MWLYVTGVMYNPIASLVKLSVLVFVLRFAGVNGNVRYIVWATGTFQVLLAVSVFIVMMADCVPFAKNWDITLPGYCVDTASFTVATGCLSIITDVISIALPIYVFANLHFVSKRRKIGMSVVCSLGML